MDFADILLIIILIVVIVGLAVLYMRSNRTGGQDASLQMLQNQIGQLTNEINERLKDQNLTLQGELRDSRNSMQQQFSQSQKALRDTSTSTERIVKEVTEKLTKLDETNKQVVGFAGQLQSLENILKNPKQRGVLGEYFLESVLKNVLPPDSFKMQFKFKNGEIVDAVINTREGIIPVDAKFSLENYNRLATAETKDERDKLEKMFKQDLRSRIDETSKYVRPEEDTLDFAFMFIPADGLYYDLLVQRVGGIEMNSVGLIEYAFSKRVIIVSPTTLFAYLQTVMQGLRALKIEESAKQIQVNVAKLQKHLLAYQDRLDKLGMHLQRAMGSYGSAHDEFRKVNKDMVGITGKGAASIEEEEVTITTVEYSKEIVTPKELPLSPAADE